MMYNKLLVNDILQKECPITGERMDHHRQFEQLIIDIATNFINLELDKIDEQINLALMKIGMFAGVDRSYIFLLLPTREVMNNTHEWYRQGIDSQISRRQNLSFSRFPWFISRIMAKKPVYIQRVSELGLEAEAEKKELQAQGIGALINIPMVLGDRVIGFLGFDYIQESTSWPDESIALLRVLGEIFVNVLERKRVEARLRLAELSIRDSEARYRQLFEDSLDAIYLTDESGKLIDINQAALEFFDYSRYELLGNEIWTLCSDEDEKGKFREELSRSGVVKNLSLRLRGRQGTEKFCLVNATTRRNNKGEFIGYQGIIRDITSFRRYEDRLKTSLEKLQNVIDGAIKAISVTTEIRDPYTAGHQKRVMQLAYAIAKQMDLSSAQIEGIKVAAMLHDIGKIAVPAEILSKPCRLSELEMSLIRQHPKTGYDILKIEDFSWPIAEIVLQHHERIDGSGYPFGIKGENILLEAKILGVADVVEAMASHRPYRPARGITRALAEIIEQSGILYEPEVVNVCVRLFVELGFQFDTLEIEIYQ